MMQMVNDINENHLGKLDRESPLKVQCVTCHHGVEKPETIDSIMLGLIDSEGLEAASARYEEPREEYYGSGAYNFDAGPLNAVAEELARGERLDEAVRVMEMNIEFHSGESHPHVLLAQIHVQRGEKEAAIASLERALEIDPDNGWARGMLERVRTGD
jgi:tetratricopeptide (TPR) repeat protein